MVLAGAGDRSRDLSETSESECPAALPIQSRFAGESNDAQSFVDDLSHMFEGAEDVKNMDEMMTSVKGGNNWR